MSITLDDYECCPTNILPDHNGRGVTYWGPMNTIVPHEDSITLYFTPTQPTCYNWKDNCNVYFNSSLNATSSTDATIWFQLNTFPPFTAFCPPGRDGYVGYQAIDLVNAKYWDGETWIPEYIDTITNTLRIINASTIDLTLSSLSIFRVYQMCTLNCGKEDKCDGSLHMGCFGSFDGQYIPCATLQAAENVGLDITRADFPCNFETCGERSYSFYQNETYNNTIVPAGGTVQWTFDFSSFSTHNYIGGDVCLFNFNKIYPTQTDTINSHVKLDTYINGHTLPWGYYLSNLGPNGQDLHALFPSFDLNSYLWYLDNGSNTVTLVNSGSVPIKMEDDRGVNVYRIYKTSPVHPYTISASAGYGGTINPSGLVEFDEHDNQSFTVTPSSGFIIYNVRVDDGTIWPCPPQCSSYVYPFYDVVGDHVIVALFDDCGACETCETGCEVSCQTGCEVSCQTGCEVSCQTTCELNCQTGCELCQVGCEVCETGCEVSCQTGCEVSCQTGCQVTCQTGCEVACQNCETCEDCQYCEVMCMTPCDLCESN